MPCAAPFQRTSHILKQSSHDNKLGMDFRTSGRTSSVFIQVRLGHPTVHYEWILRKREARLDVALHFEFPDRQENLI